MPWTKLRNLSCVRSLVKCTRTPVADANQKRTSHFHTTKLSQPLKQHGHTQPVEMIRSISQTGLWNCLEQYKFMWAKKILGTTLKTTQQVQLNFNDQECSLKLFASQQVSKRHLMITLMFFCALELFEVVCLVKHWYNLDSRVSVYRKCNGYIYFLEQNYNY